MGVRGGVGEVGGRGREARVEKGEEEGGGVMREPRRKR